MSIFPRKLTRGENCIIHLKFAYSTPIIKKINYNLKIINPNGIKVEDINNEIILGGVDKEIYYCFNTNMETILGKYRVKPTCYINGVKLKSQTANYDFFYVEGIRVDCKDDKKYCLINMSSEDTEIELIKKTNNKTNCSQIILKGKEKYENYFDADNIYIRYGNNYVEKIENKKELKFERKKELFWKLVDNDILIFDVKENKKIMLYGDEVNVWKMLDGLNNNWDILKTTNLTINKIEKIEKKLELQNLIERKN